MSQTSLDLIRAIKEGNREDIDILFRKRMVESIKPKLEEMKKKIGKTMMKENKDD